MATNFEPHKCPIFAQSTKIGTHQNKAIHSICRGQRCSNGQTFYPEKLLHIYAPLWKKEGILRCTCPPVRPSVCLWVGMSVSLNLVQLITQERFAPEASNLVGRLSLMSRDTSQFAPNPICPNFGQFVPILSQFVLLWSICPNLRQFIPKL